MDTLSNVWTIDQLKTYNARQGKYYFSPDTMRFFRSRVAPDIIHVNDGIIFITSEQFDYTSPRLYTVRIMREDGRVDQVNCEFQQFPTLRSARSHARREVAKMNEAMK